MKIYILISDESWARDPYESQRPSLWGVFTTGAKDFFDGNRDIAVKIIEFKL
jgi:hypothetical protein